MALVAVGLITVALSRLKPAAPTVEKATVWVDTVRRGPMVRQVRGLGTLVPEEIRWIPAATDGRVERIVMQPGTTVKPDTIILELLNPTQTQAALEADAQLKAAEAGLSSLRVKIENDVLAQEAAATTTAADYRQALLQAESDAQLAAEGLVSSLTSKLSKVKSDNLETRTELEQRRLAQLRSSVGAQLAVQQAEVDRLEALVHLRRGQVEALHVRAGMSGVLQEVPVEVGQQVAPGTNLARVANPEQLKAQLKIAETQAKDILIGQIASIDTRNGVIAGRVSRIDPAVQNGTVTVDVALEGDAAEGRPAGPQRGRHDRTRAARRRALRRSPRLRAGAEHRQPVQAGPRRGDRRPRQGGPRANVGEHGRDRVGGLQAGDQVILSDMSAWDAFDRVRLK